MKKLKFSHTFFILSVVLIIMSGMSARTNNVNNYFREIVNSYESDYNYLKILTYGIENKLDSVISKTNGSVPVLTYHCIGDNSGDSKELYVSPSEFRSQMKCILENGYHPIHFDDLSNLKDITKPIIITFDDGYRDNFTNAYPILKEFNIKATIFIISDAIGKDTYLDESEILKMTDIIDFQSHSSTHPHLSQLSGDKLLYEIYNSKIKVESVTGKPVFVFSYPYGDYNSDVVSLVKVYYKYALTINQGYFAANRPSTFYAINRMSVRQSTTIDELLKFIR